MLNSQRPLIANFLKEHTRQQHDEVEKALPFFSEKFQKIHYVALLKQLFFFYSSYETELTDAIGEFSIPFDLESRRKSMLIALDLKELGETSNSESSDEGLYNFNVSDLETFWGTLYVLEGATLGGQVISRHFLRRLNLPHSQLNYYLGYREQTQVMWVQFLEALEKDSRKLDFAKVTLSAQRVFFNFESMFKRLSETLELK